MWLLGLFQQTQALAFGGFQKGLTRIHWIPKLAFAPSPTAISKLICTAPAEWHANAGERRVRIRYGGKNGPDFSKICSDLGVSSEAFISLHTARAYRVEMIGFTPGFSYLGGLSDKLNVPRLLSPRQHVPAGSIGICGEYTGIYAMGGPGGWPIIGHSADDFFDASKTPPFLIEPGMSVRFEAI